MVRNDDVLSAMPGLLLRKLINGMDPVYVLGVSPSAVAISPFGTRRSVGRINV
jgi:hypothetical protein